jgi:HAD superfamily hydrolase (TIGR01509 family)
MTATVAVIFDVYGTLLHFPRDSRPFLQLARRQSDSNYRSALETALTTDNPTLSDFGARIGLPPQEDIRLLDAALEADLLAIEPFADVEPTLVALKACGIRTAVVSNLGTPYKRPFFAHGLDSLFDVVVFSCDCGLRKPDPRIYEHALKQLGSSANETIMVGDSFRSDVDGPSKLGIMGIHLVRSGGLSESDSWISSLAGVLETPLVATLIYTD